MNNDYHGFDERNFAYHFGNTPPPKRSGKHIAEIVVAFVFGIIFGLVLTIAFFIMHPGAALLTSAENAGVPDGFEGALIPREDESGENSEPTPFVRTPLPERSPVPVPSLGAANNGNDIDPKADDSVAVSELVRPSVVGIVTKTAVTLTAADEEELSTEMQQGSGSGIILTENGLIVTNNHVIASAELVYVILENGDEVPAEVIGTDSTTDLAVLKVEKEGLKPIILGDSEALKVGEKAVAVGNPLGSVGGAVTQGVISALNQDVYLADKGQTYNLIQTDAAINPGNSGGALVNGLGELIGINTLKSVIAGYDAYGNAIAAEGIGYAIPINDALPVIQTLIERGRVERPGIGIRCSEITEEQAKYNGIELGIYVAEVTAGGAADQAGMKTDDIILSVDGERMTKLDELLARIQAKKVGDKLEFVVDREGKEVKIEVTVADMNDMAVLP